MKHLSMIVATARNNVIGYEGKIPWKCPEDMRFFKAKTTGHVVIMGRKTFESIGKPLPNRLNIVITTQVLTVASTLAIWFARDLASALDMAHGARASGGGHMPDEIFVIGGERVYREAMPHAEKIYQTEIDRGFDGDVYFPTIPAPDWDLMESRVATEENDVVFKTWRRKVINR